MKEKLENYERRRATVMERKLNIELMNDMENDSNIKHIEEK